VPELGDQEQYRVAVSRSRGILERVLRAVAHNVLLMQTRR
jgi:hypothetical protein